ncbi:MAG: hypothetical protein GX640_17040 [Fibrobacter sp.]|nr:hypothetical protein [Fibrobacter sp.]
MDSSGQVADTLKNPIGIGGDIGHQNIISTIYALTAMSSSVTDPIRPDTILPLADSSRIKLLITAITDLSLAHNSPEPDEEEQREGIFTNYMQFMDEVVVKWDSVRIATRGIVRLKTIHDIILWSNRFKIIDPVYIKNYGTLIEYGLPVQQQKRKNYAFYEGYSYPNCERRLCLDQW